MPLARAYARPRPHRLYCPGKTRARGAAPRGRSFERPSPRREHADDLRRGIDGRVDEDGFADAEALELVRQDDELAIGRAGSFSLVPPVLFVPAHLFGRRPAQAGT